MKKGVKVAGFIGVVLFIYILLNINIESLFSILVNINIPILMCAICLNLIAVILKSIKWKYIVNSIMPEFSIRQSIVGFLVGFAVSTLTPAKAGDAVRALYVADENTPLGEALATVGIDRIIDLTILFVLGIVAMVALFYIEGMELFTIAMVICLFTFFVFAVYLFFHKEIMATFLQPFFHFLVPESYKGRISELYHSFYDGLHRYMSQPHCIRKSVGTALLLWLFPFLYAYLLALSLGIEISFMLICISLPLISLIDLLPISISGIGTRDAALVYLFGLESIAPEQTIAFSLTYLIFSYWFIALLGGICLLRYPIDISNI